VSEKPGQIYLIVGFPRLTIHVIVGVADLAPDGVNRQHDIIDKIVFLLVIIPRLFRTDQSICGIVTVHRGVAVFVGQPNRIIVVIVFDCLEVAERIGGPDQSISIIELLPGLAIERIDFSEQQTVAIQNQRGRADRVRFADLAVMRRFYYPSNLLPIIQESRPDPIISP